MSLILAILTAALSVLLIGQISDIYKRQVYKNIFLENVNKLNPEGQEINFNILITDAMRGVFEELKAKGVGPKVLLEIEIQSDKSAIIKMSILYSGLVVLFLLFGYSVNPLLPFLSILFGVLISRRPLSSSGKISAVKHVMKIAAILSIWNLEDSMSLDTWVTSNRDYSFLVHSLRDFWKTKG